MDRARLKGYGALLIVFVLGIVVGGGAARAMLQRRYARGGFREGAMFEQRRLGALARRLDLSTPQEQQVRAIMAKYAPARRELARDMLERCGGPLRDQKARIDTEIRAQLNPDQQARYDQLVSDSNRRGPLSGLVEPAP